MMNETPPYNPETTMRRQSLDVRGVEYSINEWGDEKAPMFVYLHGWADTGSTFQFVVDELASNWRVIAPDWRGFGRSGHAAGTYWFPDYLADLHEILGHYSPDAPLPVVGHSMGGNIASLYAGTMPERVSAFINIEGFGLTDSAPADAPDRYRQWIETDRERPHFVSYSGFENLAMRVRKRSPGISAAMAEFVAREWAFEQDDGSIKLWADPAHKLPNPVLYRRAEAEACWKNISAAVLLVQGEESPFSERAGGISTLAFPNAESLSVAGTGHMLHFEAPQRLASLIEAFLRKPL